MGNSGSIKSSTMKKKTDEEPFPRDPTTPDNDSGDADGETDNARELTPQVWDISKASYMASEIEDDDAHRACTTDGCGGVSVTASASASASDGGDPDELSETVRVCQAIDFTCGWPDGFFRPEEGDGGGDSDDTQSCLGMGCPVQQRPRDEPQRSSSPPRFPQTPKPSGFAPDKKRRMAESEQYHSSGGESSSKRQKTTNENLLSPHAEDGSPGLWQIIRAMVAEIDNVDDVRTECSTADGCGGGEEVAVTTEWASKSDLEELWATYYEGNREDDVDLCGGWPEVIPVTPDEGEGGGDEDDDDDDGTTEVLDSDVAAETDKADDAANGMCVQDGCGDEVAVVAAQASNGDPDKLWETFEGCEQAVDDFTVAWSGGFVLPEEGEGDRGGGDEDTRSYHPKGCPGRPRPQDQQQRPPPPPTASELPSRKQRRSQRLQKQERRHTQSSPPKGCPGRARPQDELPRGRQADGLNHDWNIVRAYTVAEMDDVDTRRTCMTEDCDAIAVAAWASDGKPRELWETCEVCQENDFGGWPEGFIRPDDDDGSGDEDDDGDSEVWDIVRAYTAAEMRDVVARRTCMTDGCGGVAVAAWVSDGDPEELWETCEGCQAIDFGGWPEGFVKPFDDDGGGDDDDDDRTPEVWDIFWSYTAAERDDVDARRTCMAGGCSEVAVAAWTSDKNPWELWETCEECQENDFGGWPEGFIGPDDDDGSGDEDDDGTPEVWDIVRAYTSTEMKNADSRKTCMTHGCGRVAVAVWTSDMDPGALWDTCERCQVKEFGGWPEEFENIRHVLINRCNRGET